MDVLHERAAALDIGKRDLKACVRTSHPSRRNTRHSQVRTFATTTIALLELRDWLVAEQVTIVVMEATGRLLAPAVLPVGGRRQRDPGQRRARQGPARA
jgi:hypothetical protein